MAGMVPKDESSCDNCQMVAGGHTF